MLLDHIRTAGLIGAKEATAEDDVTRAIGEALAGDDPERAFSILCDADALRAYQMAVRMLRDGAAAEDAVQDALIQVRAGLGQGAGRVSPRAWMLRIVYHRAIDELRRRKRRARHEIGKAEPGDAIDGAPTPAEATEAEEEARLLERSLGVLRPETRVAVLLRFREELSYDQIGAVIGEQADTVRQRITRALPRLRRRLAQLGVRVGTRSREATTSARTG